MKSNFLIDVYDLTKHRWVTVMHYSTRKVALFKYNQVRKVFPKLKYRLYEVRTLRLK